MLSTISQKFNSSLDHVGNSVFGAEWELARRLVGSRLGKVVRRIDRAKELT